MNHNENLTYEKDYKFIPATSIGSGIGHAVLPDLYCHTIQIVNICFIGEPEKEDFALIDAGMPHSAKTIFSVTEERFGTGRKPKAIILTHGHFDHVGAVVELIEKWDIPVYAHEMELPFLTGKKAYPEPDPSVEGGMIAKLSSFFPNEPVNLGSCVKKLPDDQHIPGLPEWKWIHTPGHTPGHISLFRENDRALIAGDAFVTVRQESLYKVLTQKPEISGPPRYFTTDWQAAKSSVIKLNSLQPSVVITGHGLPFSGVPLHKGLNTLATEFDRIAVPGYGKYV